MKNQVLSIEQMKHLQELGVDTSKASMVWGGTKDWQELYTPRLLEFDTEANYIIETFTLQDMLEIMPYLLFNTYFLNINKSSNKWWFIKYTDYLAHDDYEFWHSSDLLDVAYQCLCWLAENDYLKGGKK